MAPHMEVVYDFDKKLEEIGRRLLFSDFQDELDRRYPILNELGIDDRYGLEWEAVIEHLFLEIRRLRTSLKKGRMKSKLDRVRSIVGSIKESLLVQEPGSRV
jgi:hypothetical protein